LDGHQVPIEVAAAWVAHFSIMQQNACGWIEPIAVRSHSLYNVEATNRNKEMATKPSIVLVHGFWGVAAHWTTVIIQLSKMGYDSINAVENPLTSLADGAERTRKMVAQQKGPVLLVGHSYGGAVITAAGNQRTLSVWSISQHLLRMRVAA
jgi:pimeloyl-ACP methyl ester carboxylesterase